MKTITLSATFDGERIRLEDNHPLPKNARLLVTVLPMAASDPERAEWIHIAAQNLSRAYDENEPDYPDSCVKEPNLLYDRR